LAEPFPIRPLQGQSEAEKMSHFPAAAKQVGF